MESEAKVIIDKGVRSSPAPNTRYFSAQPDFKVC